MTNKIEFYKYLISAAKLGVITLGKAHGVKEKRHQRFIMTFG